MCAFRYLVSVMETFLLYQHFRPTPEPSGGPLLRAYFWLHFLLQSCQPFKKAPPQEDQCLVGQWDPGTQGRGLRIMTDPFPLLRAGSGARDK